MKLSKLFERSDYKILQGSLDREITGISLNTKQVADDNLFICIKGARFDSHSCLQEIADQGAAAIVVERPLAQCGPLDADVTVIQTASTRIAEAQIEAAWYGHPADQLTTIGITGSKGKTTTTHMLAGILRCAGRKVGVIGTNGAEIGDEIHELANTTPSADEVQMYLREMVDKGMDTAVIECSSQGLKQYRVGGFQFDCGIFMNISEGDHIGPNEHPDFADYLRCKGLLIKNSKQGFVNQDDPRTAEMLQDIDTPVINFGRTPKADYYIKDTRKTFQNGMPGHTFTVGGRLEDTFYVNLPGEFNVDNALAAIAAADYLKVPVQAMKDGLAHLSIKGRFDLVYKSDDLTVCVDFAHNGLSTRNHLEAVREYHPKRIVCVFGADGNRSKDRRYEMGEASGRLADFSIITAGHNRWETFDAIADDILVGMHKTDGRYIIIPDRKKAIRYAIEHRQPGDFITILGLGHESYQEENGVKYPYSDIETVKELTRELIPEKKD